MSKAEEYIKKRTRGKVNHITENFPWIPTNEALEAVEIAREEAIEQTVEWLTKHAKKYYFNKERYLGTDELVDDYKLIMSMKDE